MSIWIEIHCDKLLQGPDDPARIDPFCYTNKNENPGVLTFNTRTHIASALKHVEKEAKKSGWKKIKGDWSCPACANFLK